MDKLTRADLFTLEQYAAERPAFRARVMAHKQSRRIALGEHLSLLFEDRLTIQYQIQEMLRVERIFEAAGIEDELGAYNPLIPDGTNLKATLLIEYPDIEQRRVALARLKGVEDRVWLRVAGHEPVHAIADEDLERENEEKTSSVHFLRFEFGPSMLAALHGGAALGAGCDHPNYAYTVESLLSETREALLADLRPVA